MIAVMGAMLFILLAFGVFYFLYLGWHYFFESGDPEYKAEKRANPGKVKDWYDNTWVTPDEYREKLRKRQTGEA